MGEAQEISILGCGWLGLPLAEQLVKAGYTVKGSTTTPEKLDMLKSKDIQPFLIDLKDAQLVRQHLAAFLDSEVLVLNIPPKLRSDGGESYLQQMHVVLKAMLDSPVKRLLFVSSTSVYQDLNRVVTEEDISYTKELDPDNMLLQAEEMFQNRDEWVTTIVRFGGLVGGSRQPGRFLAGKKHLPNGDAPVNLIHLDDCVAILQRIIEQQQWNKTYNACADQHPMRKEFFTKAAESLALTPPEFDDMEETHFKIIKSQKLQHDLSYVFLHPDPMQFF